MTEPDKTALIADDIDHADADEFSPPENAAAAVCRWLSDWIAVGLVLMMGTEMLVRSVFGWSIQWSNEVGGYALVAITFLSMGSGQLLHAYHRVHFVEARLSLVGRARLRMGFDIACLLMALILTAEFARFEWITWHSGDVAATSLLTPLWIPRLVLPIGAAVLSWALLLTVTADWRRLRAALGKKGQ